MKRWEQLVCVAASLLLIAPGLIVTLIGAAMTLPVLVRQLAAWNLTNVKAVAA